MYYLLLYDVVENYVEKRKPLREAHLELAKKARARGELVLAGAFTDPVDGAELLEDLIPRLRAYLATDEHSPVALALWTLHAHAHDAAAISPLLALVSAGLAIARKRRLSAPGSQ